MIEKYTIMLLVIIVVQASLAVRRTSKGRLGKRSLTLTDSLHTILRAEGRTTDPDHTVRRRSHRNGDNIGPSHPQAYLQPELCGRGIATYQQYRVLVRRLFCWLAESYMSDQAGSTRIRISVVYMQLGQI